MKIVLSSSPSIVLPDGRAGKVGKIPPSSSGNSIFPRTCRTHPFTGVTTVHSCFIACSTFSLSSLVQTRRFALYTYKVWVFQ